MKEQEKLRDLRELRLLTRQVILRWLILTPYNTRHLAPLLDAAADGMDRQHTIDEPLRTFFAVWPPQDPTHA